MNKTTDIPDKNGRQRIRRSFVVYPDTADKFSRIAKLSGVSASELLNAAMSQTVEQWEREHGELKITVDAVPPSIDLTAAVSAAQATPNLKRGNPHPSGRKPNPNKYTALYRTFNPIGSCNNAIKTGKIIGNNLSEMIKEITQNATRETNVLWAIFTNDGTCVNGGIASVYKTFDHKWKTTNIQDMAQRYFPDNINTDYPMSNI